MKKIIILALLFFLPALSGCTEQTSADVEIKENKPSAPQNSQSANDYPMSDAENLADRLEVYYFHRTARCYSCNIMEQFIKELAEKNYSQQVQNGIIDFREINIDLPENKEVAKKFRASGSSLFINKITNGQDKIEEDVNVWRHLNNEANFKKYLAEKINSSLGL